jgi:hypothetical protein
MRTDPRDVDRFERGLLYVLVGLTWATLAMHWWINLR